MAVTDEAYGQGHAESVVRSQYWRRVENSAAYLAPELTAGRDVLDIGCGPGTITTDIARLVAPGRVVGVDVSDHILNEARQSAASAETDNVTFERADVQALPAESDSFDVVHAHQVLMHLMAPVDALREMLRVARPGGVVAARDADFAAPIWWPADPRLDRWLEVYRAVSGDNGTEPRAGRRLLAWAHTAGATDVTPSASVWCHSTPAERAWWGGMWADRILGSRIAEQAVAGGHATRAELEDISTAWREWAAHPDGWFAILHGEVRCHV